MSNAGAGLLAPFELQGGSQALVIGCQLGGFAGVLHELGCQVTAVDPHRTHAPDAGASIADGQADLGPALFVDDWLIDGRVESIFDLVFLHDLTTDALDDRGVLPKIIAAAARALRPDGLLLFHAENPWGLGRLLRARTADSAPAGYGRAAVRGLVEACGFDHQRWLLPYPDHRVPEVIVDAKLWDEPGGSAQARAWVRRPVAGPSSGRPFNTDPLSAFGQASDAGLAADVADHFLVVATRGDARTVPGLLDGLLWLVPPPDYKTTWRWTRSLRRNGDDWSLESNGPDSAPQSGPLSLAFDAVAVPVGRSAEDAILEAARTTSGVAGALENLLRAWWRAVEPVLAEPPEGPYHFEVDPRHFLITASDEWRYVPPVTRYRFTLPPAVLAYRALHRLVGSAMLGSERPPDIDATQSVDGAVRLLMDTMDLPNGPETSYLWAELEADMLARTSSTETSRQAHKDELQRMAGRPIWATSFDAPLDRQEKALVAGELASDAETVIDRLGELDRQVTATHREVRDRDREIAAFGRRAVTARRDNSTLRRQLHRHDHETEAARAEAEAARAEAEAARAEAEAARVETEAA